MTEMEMEQRCKEAAEQFGEKTLNATVKLLADLEYDLHEWIHEGHENTEQLGLAIGHCYAGLKMLEFYTDVDPNDVETGTLEVLSYV